jgi:hypothetical protein
MNDRYLVYLDALAQRDRYALILLAIVVGLLLADWALLRFPRVRTFYRGYLLALWLGLWLLALYKVAGGLL